MDHEEIQKELPWNYIDGVLDEGLMIAWIESVTNEESVDERRILLKTITERRSSVAGQQLRCLLYTSRCV